MATPANLSEIQATLTASLSPLGELALTAAMVPPGDFATFLLGLPSGTLPLRDAAIVASGEGDAVALTLTGNLAAPLATDIPVLSLTDMAVEIVFRQDPVSAPTATVTIPSATMASQARRVSLAGGLRPGAVLGLTGPSAGDAPAAVDLVELVGVLTDSRTRLPPLPAGPGFLAAPLSSVGLDMAFAGRRRTALTIGSTLAASWTPIEGLAFVLADPTVSLRVERDAVDADGHARQAYGGALAADMTIGSEAFRVAVGLAPGDVLTIDLMPADGQVAPALADIAGEIGGDALRETVRSGLAALHFDQIALDRIEIGFDVGARKLSRATLHGRMTLGGGTVGLVVQLSPGFSLTAALRPARLRQDGGSGILLSALAAEILGETAGLPALEIDALSLFADPGAGTYRAMVETKEDWTWDLSGTGAGPALTLKALGFDAARAPGGSSGGLSAVLALGGFDVGLSAAYRGSGQGWLFAGSAAQAEPVSPAAFLQDLGGLLGVAIPDPLSEAVQNLKIVALDMGFDTASKAFAFRIETDGQGTVPFGLGSYDLDLRLGLQSTVDPATGARTLDGNFEADLQIGDATFVVDVTFGPVKTVTGRWTSPDGATLGLKDIVAAVGLTDMPDLPAELDLGLTAAAFEHRSDTGSFVLSGTSALFGDAFFALVKGDDGGWGFVFGVDHDTPGKLSDLPVIGGDLTAADFLTVEQAAFVVASTGLKSFTVPGLPALPPAPGTASLPTGRGAAGRTVQPVAGGASLQLQRGLSLAAVVDFATSQDARFANLKTVVGESRLMLQASFGPSVLSLYAALAGRVAIPAGGQSRLVLGNPAVRIDVLPALDFRVSGTLAFPIGDTPVTATAALVLSETAAQVLVSLAADQGTLPPPPGIPGLRIEQFGVEMGVFFEPPGVDLGLQGRFRIGDMRGGRADQFAFVLAMTGEVPNVLYLSFYLEDADFGQLVRLFVDRPDPELMHSLKLVRGSDLSFHWSESQVVLPDGTVALPGFGFSGAVTIGSFDAFAELEVSVAEGIHGHAELTPIDLRGVLKIGGDGMGMFRTFQQVGSDWTRVANNSVHRTVPALPTRKETLIAPGGPVVQFSSTKTPYLHVNWDVTLFDLVHSRVDATIDDSGFSFTLTYDVAGIERFDLACKMRGADKFDASAALAVHLDASVGPIRVRGVEIGSIHLVASLAAAIDVRLDPRMFSLHLSGGFDFEGFRLTMPNLELQVAPSSLKELPGQAVQQIRDAADSVFATVFDDARRWADMVGRGVMLGVNEMAGVLKDAYARSADEAAQIMRDAGRAAETVARGLNSAYGATTEATAAALRNAGYAADEAASGIRTAYGVTADAAAAALKQAGYAANEVASGLRTAYGATADAAATALRYAGYGADQIASGLSTGYALGAEQAAQALRQIGFGANEVAGALGSAYNSSADQAASILRTVGFGVDEVGGALRSVFNESSDRAAQILAGAGFAVNEVGQALKDAYGATADTVASGLRDAGYAVDQVGDFVRNAFQLGPDNLRSVLEGVGFAGDQVKGFFQSLGGQFADIFSDIGEKLDPRNW